MKEKTEQDAKIAAMTFSSIYPCYVAKVEKKGRTKEELDQVIQWLTRLDSAECQKLIDQEVSFKTFFEKAVLNENAHLIKGSICGQ